MPRLTSEGTFCYFVVYLGQKGFAHTSTRTYLSGVQQFSYLMALRILELKQEMTYFLYLHC